MSNISKRRIDKLIPLALDAIREAGLPDPQGRVSKTYHGYISSLGADMINATPLAAIIFFEEGKKADEGGGSGSKEDRSKVTDAILKLLRKELGNGIDGVSNSWDKLSKYYSSSTHSDRKKIENITAAAAALKIALRTFPKSS